MHRIRCIWLCVVVLFGAAVTPVSAQEGTTIAVVDIQRLLQESLAGQAIDSQMQQFRMTFGEQIVEKEDALREKERQLMDSASVVTPEVLAEERRQFEEEVIALQREVRERQLAIEQTYAEAIGTVRQTVITILQAVVEERGIDVVLSRASYLVANRELDLTDDILEELNRALPSMTLNLPSGG